MPLDNYQANRYAGSSFENEYEIDTGAAEMPRCIAVSVLQALDSEHIATTPVVRRVQLHAPITRRKVTVTARKLGTPPVMPAPVDTVKPVGPSMSPGVPPVTPTQNGLILTGAVMSLPQPQLNVNQNGYNWNMGGQYMYTEVFYHPYNLGYALGNPAWITPTDESVPLGSEPSATVGMVNSDQMLVSSLNAQNIGFGGAGWRYNDNTYYPGVFMDRFLIAGNEGRLFYAIKEENLAQATQGVANGQFDRNLGYGTILVGGP